ncbi:hypothetical protein H0V99_02670 [Candidatus Saccharibacteria bacterium]|nr:hypothetical protein [Candidatus Saccharibacteria bacterium]
MRNGQQGFSVIKIIIAFLLLVLIAFIAFRVSRADESIRSANAVTNFDECVTAGNPIMESYPEQCSTNGQTYFRPDDPIKDEPQADLQIQNNVLFSEVKPALQDEIKRVYKERAPDCMQGDNFAAAVDEDKLISKYTPSAFASVLIGCEGGAAGLFAYGDNKWLFIAATQDTYPCSILETYDVPHNFITGSTDILAECVEESGISRTYKG